MEYLYINDQYCATFEQLKSLLADDRNQKESGFRKEILSYYRDGILQEWLEALGKNEVKFSSTESTDNETFKSIVKAITGEEVKGDIMSKFNEVGELIRVEFNGKNNEVLNGKVAITNFKSGKIKFILKCLRPENNEFVFSFGEQTKSLIWNNYTRTQEVVMEFDVEKEGVYQLKEGKVNTLSSIEIKSNVIDLGLSVLWADRNIGAEKPDEFGMGFKRGDNYSQIIKEKMGEGWRLPTMDEVNDLLLKTVKYRFSNQMGIDISFENIKMQFPGPAFYLINRINFYMYASTNDLSVTYIQNLKKPKLYIRAVKDNPNFKK